MWDYAALILSHQYRTGCFTIDICVIALSVCFVRNFCVSPAIEERVLLVTTPLRYTIIL